MNPTFKQRTLFSQKPLIVVKFPPEINLPYEADAQDKTNSRSLRDSWRSIREISPAATLKPLYSEVTLSDVYGADALIDHGRTLLPVDSLDTLFYVEPSSSALAVDLTHSLNQLPDTQYAYIMGGPVPPPGFNPNDDPLFNNQGYLMPGPHGIDIIQAQNFPCGDGSGIKFIDIEQGWVLDHEDLLQANISLLSGLNSEYFGHGTSVLGQVVASDNKKGIVGIARSCQAGVISQWRGPSQYRTDLAILDAVKRLRPGDVLLLEAQAAFPTGSSNFFPVEIEPLILNAIRIAFNKGVVVIEAAGNGGNDLDNFRGGVLNRNSSHFAESGAIMIGAGSSGLPHRRLNFSNFGNRIDCYAWGEHITTTGDGFEGRDPRSYTNSFGGTSGASPIITGVAIIIQAIQKALSGSPFMPEDLIRILKDPQSSTPSGNPMHDRIGTMPDLKLLLNNVFGRTL